MSSIYWTSDEDQPVHEISVSKSSISNESKAEKSDLGSEEKCAVAEAAGATEAGIDFTPMRKHKSEKAGNMLADYSNLLFGKNTGESGGSGEKGSSIKKRSF